MLKYSRYVLSLLVVGVVSARGELTLSNAVAEALARHPELKAARQKVEAATGRAVQARLWENPELELSAEDMPVNSGGLSQSKNMIGLSQTVPFPGKKSLDDGIGRKAVTALEWEYRSREIELVRDVKSAFYRALAAKQKLIVDSELAELAKSTATVARKRVEAGSTGDQEQLRAEVEQERVAVEMAAARRELAEAQKCLTSLVGQSGDPVGELAEQVNPLVLDQAREQMLARHPDLRAARANRERAELELRRAKLDPLPDVRFGVAGGCDLAAHETMMEFRVSVPLPIFDRSQGRKREARAHAEIARYDISVVELRLTRELDQLEERLRASGEQVETYRTRILPKTETAARLVRGGFEAGKFSLLDMLDMQRTAVETRLAYLDKLLELNLALAEIEALTGTQTKE